MCEKNITKKKFEKNFCVKENGTNLPEWSLSQYFQQLKLGRIRFFTAFLGHTDDI